MNSYYHKVQYYETDQMGVVHHSNYIRWFEESRVDMMQQWGFSYAHTERIGILIPVLGVSCEYKVSAKFEDVVEIIPQITKITPVKLLISYTVKNSKTGEIIALGESKHCFVNKDFRPVSLLKYSKELYDLFNDSIILGRKSDEI